MKPPYREACPRNLAVIGRRLIEHCLAFFADPHCVGVTIGDDELRIDLNKEFQETFLTKASEHKFKAGENLFKLRGFRLYKAQETQHELLYAADSREVLKENLGKYLPNLQRKLNDENGLFAYVGFIEGDYLNNHVSSDRTSFTFPSETSAADLFRELSLQEIRDSALDVDRKCALSKTPTWRGYFLRPRFLRDFASDFSLACNSCR